MYIFFLAAKKFKGRSSPLHQLENDSKTEKTNNVINKTQKPKGAANFLLNRNVKNFRTTRGRGVVTTRRQKGYQLGGHRKAEKRDADTKHYNNKWAAPGGVLHYYYCYYYNKIILHI